MGKRLQTVAALGFTKTLLMLYNFMFWLTGVAILAAGVWMQVSLDKYMELSEEFSAKAPYVLLGVGALMILVGSLACCCTVKGQAVLLYIYAAFLLVIFVVQLAAGVSIYAYRNKLEDGFYNGLNRSLTNYKTDPVKREDFDFMQSELKCCGINGPNDWPENLIPTSCCIEKGCDPNHPNLISNEGCFKKVVDFLHSNIGIVAGSALGVACIPLVGFLLSCCLARNINKAKYEQMA